MYSAFTSRSQSASNSLGANPVKTQVLTGTIDTKFNTQIACRVYEKETIFNDEHPGFFNSPCNKLLTIAIECQRTKYYLPHSFLKAVHKNFNNLLFLIVKLQKNETFHTILYASQENQGQFNN